MWSRIRRYLEGRTVLKNVLTLVSGSILAQIAAVSISIFTARIFTPEVFGQFALYGSITGILVTMASLRYDMAIVLPSDDDTARMVAKVATRSNIGFAVLASITCIALRPVFADLFDDETLAFWLSFSGLTVFFVAQVTVLQYWYNRLREYRTIAANRVQQTVGSSLGQLGFGVAGLTTMPGLLFGTLLGQAFAYGNLTRKAGSLRQPVGPDAPSVREVMKRYRRMPLLNLPNALVDSVRLNGISILIGYIAVGALGQFNLAWRLLQMPVQLITGGVSQVFYERMTHVKPGGMFKLVRFVSIRTFLVGLIPFALIFALSPWLFLFVFGDQWDMAGGFARALIPWLMLQVVTSPISTIFVVTDKQHWALIFSVFYCVVPLAILFFSPWNLLPTVQLLGAAMATLLLVNLMLAFAAAKAFDRQVPVSQS